MITKMYAVSGMVCDGCLTTVKTAIKNLPGVIEARVQFTEPQAIVSMQQEISAAIFQNALTDAGQYSIREIKDGDGGRGDEKGSGRKLNKVLGLFHHKKECCK
ncbi:MAG TPA: heavy metal-associated domain-containing protein [Chitinophagaceae bacterium]|nr:heavy metal-associated domain-containing protein [Chitinophagaceae bacterium]